jgi:3-oxoacyl-[acyl-carrier-protein] synthase III
VSRWLSGRTAIAGIGQTEFSKESGRTELQLACESVRSALDDAGLEPADVDGLVTFTLDSSEEMDVARTWGFRACRCSGVSHTAVGLPQES